jgi:hypothetical protein
LHDGRFQLDSAVGKGTRARVHLPSARIVKEPPAGETLPAWPRVHDTAQADQPPVMHQVAVAA